MASSHEVICLHVRLAPQVNAAAAVSSTPRCLIPDFNGALLSSEAKDALWARFFMGAPQRQRRSVERYSIVKRA